MMLVSQGWQVSRGSKIKFTRLKSVLRARPRCARIESSSGLTFSTPMVRTHALDPTPDAPRSYNTGTIQLLEIIISISPP